MASEILTKVYLKIGKRLHAIAGQILSDNEEADDALQDAFERLWSRNITIKSEKHAEGILVTTVKNISVDRLRSAAVIKNVTIESAGIMTSECENNDCENTIGSVIALIEQKLSDRDKTILYRRDRDGWEIEDIAKSLNLSEANVRLILSRARRLIRETYKTYRKQ